MNKNVAICCLLAQENNGSCSKIVDFISNYYIRTNVSGFKINQETFAPCGGCDYQCLKQNTICPQLKEHQITIMDTVCRSDLVNFVVPKRCARYILYLKTKIYNRRSINGDLMDSKQAKADLHAFLARNILS